MDAEFAMRDELYNSDFCFSRQDLFDKEKNYDYTQKYYAFDCNIGSFCCLAEKENILKIIEIAKKYKLEDIFLNKMFDKISLLKFKINSIEEIKKHYGITGDLPAVFWFYRWYNMDIRGQLLKDYLEL
jgi:hypothetical protein